MSDEGSFLARWSKRKREAAAPAPEDAPQDGDETPAAEATGEAFDLSTLPDIETLTGQSDLSAFMHRAVPEALRNAALRKVWALDPSVRGYVGEALDYAWDWNTPGGVPGFGEALASEETLTFVRNLLAGPQDNENVIARETAEDGGDARKTGADADEAKQVASADDPRQTIGNAGIPETFSEPAQNAERDPALSRRRRHGGALPG